MNTLQIDTFRYELAKNILNMRRSFYRSHNFVDRFLCMFSPYGNRNDFYSVLCRVHSGEENPLRGCKCCNGFGLVRLQRFGRLEPFYFICEDCNTQGFTIRKNQNIFEFCPECNGEGIVYYMRGRYISIHDLNSISESSFDKHLIDDYYDSRGKINDLTNSFESFGRRNKNINDIMEATTRCALCKGTGLVTWLDQILV